MSQTFGRTWKTGDIFIGLEAYNRSDLSRSARPFLSQDLRPYGGTDQRSTRALTPNVVVAGVRLPYRTFTGSPNLYDPIQGDFLPEQTRYNGFSIRQDLNDDIQVWYEGYFPAGGSSPTMRPSAAPSACRPPTLLRHRRAGGGSGGQPHGGIPPAAGRPPQRSQGVFGPKRGRDALGPPAEWQFNGYATRSFDSAVTGIGGEQLNNQAIPAALRDSNPATALNVFGGPISDAVYSRIIAFRLAEDRCPAAPR